MDKNGNISVRVWGDYACFSRPEFKVERVSYPVITPSAARGLLEAIYWKPEIRYEIRRIGILKLGSQTVILRNEVEDKQGTKPYFIEDKRQQRSSLILKGVEYIIDAEVIVKPGAKNKPMAYYCQFDRRLKRGQCYHTPYFGTREFAANFEPVNVMKPPESEYDRKIENLLFEIAFIESTVRDEMEFMKRGKEKPVKGYAQALFYDAEIRGGWLEVPKGKYQELYKMEASNV